MSHVLPAVDSIHNVRIDSVVILPLKCLTCAAPWFSNFPFFKKIYFLSPQVGIYCLCLVAPGGLPKVSLGVLCAEKH